MNLYFDDNANGLIMQSIHVFLINQFMGREEWVGFPMDEFWNDTWPATCRYKLNCDLIKIDASTNADIGWIENFDLNSPSKSDFEG